MANIKFEEIRTKSIKEHQRDLGKIHARLAKAIEMLGKGKSPAELKSLNHLEKALEILECSLFFPF